MKFGKFDERKSTISTISTITTSESANGGDRFNKMFDTRVKGPK